MLSVTAACLLAAFWGGVSPGSPTRRLLPRTKADYGSGATVQTDWYGAGGLGPSVGVFVGHPNPLARGDRALVRFDTMPYLLPPTSEAPVHAAMLAFRVEYFCGADDMRRIEVSHLRYDALGLSGNDLVNKDAEVVGVVTVRRDTATATPYRLDVTAFVKADLARGNRYSAYRFRDIDAESKGNTEMKPTGVVIYSSGTLPSLDIRETKEVGP